MNKLSYTLTEDFKLFGIKLSEKTRRFNQVELFDKEPVIVMEIPTPVSQEYLDQEFNIEKKDK